LSALRLHTFLRAAAANGRTVVAVPPFTAYLDPSDPLRFLNYAIPDGDVDATAADVERLRATFREHDRLPRLEWLEEIAPRLAGVLGAAGMSEELRTPLQACEPDELVDAPAEVDDLTIVAVGEADLRDCENLQRVAFGEAPLADDQEPRGLSGGAVLARSADVPVAAASWTRVVDGVSEIVGVATAEPWRRRGLAGALTAAATRAAFEADASLCILSPGNETAQRVYARAGFRRVATMLHWSDPS
jgi:ribosomal protein S18 acetylase RimI-like enzyme